MKISPSLCALLTALAALSHLAATPAPNFELMKNAPEQIHIEVLSVKAERISSDSTLRIHVEAKVIEVTKSASQLHVGQSIIIEYLTGTPSEGSRLGTCVTPQLPVLSKGSQYPAHLFITAGAVYAPVATWAAFQF